MAAATFRVALTLSLFVAAAAVNAIDEDLEDSAFVQSQVVMGSGTRRVVPLQDDEDLEDDADALDEDTPSLMQAEVCTKQAKSKLQRINEEGITDEMSMLQEDIAMHYQRDAIEEEEEDEYSAIQTEMVMVAPRRSRVEDDEFDGASLMQSESKVINKKGQSVDSCKFNKATDDADDEVSLMQTDVVEEAGTDRSAFVQAGIMVKKNKRRIGGDNSADEPTEQDETMFMQSHASGVCTPQTREPKEQVTDDTSLFQTTITLGKGPRRVGRGDEEDDEDDLEEDGTAFFQGNVGLQQGDHVAEGDLNLGRVKICQRQRTVEDEDDEDEESDEFAL